MHVTLKLKKKILNKINKESIYDQNNNINC